MSRPGPRRAHRGRSAPGRRAAASAMLAALAGLAPIPVGAQQAQQDPADQPSVRSAVIGDTVRVGDVVPVAVRVTVERGERVAWPDTLPLEGDRAENAARVRERVDTLEDGRLSVTGVYAVTPWRPGEVELGELSLDVVTGRERTRTVMASLPVLDVVSVLPPDTAGIEPKPAKGVIGRSWSWWPILLALLALAAIIAALIWWRRRARGGEALPLEPPVPPREQVLARLQEAREAGLIEAGAMNEFYTRVSWALREYLSSLNGGWGEDLTTTELLGRFRAQVGPDQARSLGDVLRPADQVKFARRRPDAATATAEWQAARDWVAGFQWPPGSAVDAREEAA